MKILFIDGTKGFSPRRIAEKPTGGTLTSLTLVPRYLAKKGLSVDVLSTYDKVDFVDGVRYILKPIERNIYDAVVLNRNMLSREVAAFFKDSRKIWWLHDIVDHRYLQDDGYKFIDTVVALSDYCRASFSDFYGIPADKFVVIPNGVDKAVFHPGAHDKRDRNLYVYASAPIKGFYPLSFVFANMRRLNPQFELRMYSNQSLHELDNTDGMSRQLAALRDEGVKVLDPIPQAELAEVLRRAWALLMPNHYPEINSNLLLQARASGLPAVASPIGSATQFIDHGVSGLLTRTTASDWYWWWKDYAEQCAILYLNEELHKRISAQSPIGVKSWDDIGEAWYELLVKAEVPA